MATDRQSLVTASSLLVNLAKVHLTSFRTTYRRLKLCPLALGLLIFFSGCSSCWSTSHRPCFGRWVTVTFIITWRLKLLNDDWSRQGAIFYPLKIKSCNLSLPYLTLSIIKVQLTPKSFFLLTYSPYWPDHLCEKNCCRSFFQFFSWIFKFGNFRASLTRDRA